jgi:hypothetical protein
LNLADCYFITECLEYLVDKNKLGTVPWLYVDDNLNGFIVYTACDDVNTKLYKIMTTEKYPFVNMPIYFNGLSSYTQFEPISIQAIQHASYIPNSGIRDAYVDSLNILGSKELNISMSLFLQDNEYIHDDISKRILVILNEFKTLTKHISLCNESYIVYHGTLQEIHNTQTFVTTAFLSTTRSFSTACLYGPDIYVIIIPSKFPVINFNDTLQQLLLPIGTHIKVDKIMRHPLKLIFCHIKDEPIILDPLIEIFKNPCTRHNHVTLNYIQTLKTSNKSKLIRHIQKGNELKPVYLKGSSTFFETVIDKTKYYIKDIVKAKAPDLVNSLQTDQIRVLQSDNQVFKRILNELLAARIYSQVYKLVTQDYQVIDKRHDQLDIESSNYLMISQELNIHTLYVYHS